MNGAQERILRYTFAERLNHWIGAFSYFYCLLTGLGFWSPYMFWLTALVGGGPTARFWHPWLGLVFAVSIFWMYRIWHADMRIDQNDRAWKAAIGYYVRNEDEELPAIGRFNYGQKQFFWLMLLSATLLLVSGIGLWFVESLSPWLRHLSILVHVVFALVTIGLFTIHVYMGTAMVRGGFTSIVRGEVSRAWARTHHRLWYNQVTGQRSSR